MPGELWGLNGTKVDLRFVRAPTVPSHRHALVGGVGAINTDISGLVVEFDIPPDMPIDPEDIKRISSNLGFSDADSRNAALILACTRAVEKIGGSFFTGNPKDLEPTFIAHYGEATDGSRFIQRLAARFTGEANHNPVWENYDPLLSSDPEL